MPVSLESRVVTFFSKENMKKEFEERFNKIFKEQDINNTDLQISTSHPASEDSNSSAHRTDCMFGRSLSTNGIYSCPFLSNDYRGRVGSSFKDFSKSISGCINKF